MRMKRKGIVFTLDVIASLVVLIAAVGVVSLIQHSAELPSVQYGNLNSIALDSVAVLEKSKVRDVENLPVVRDFLASGVVIDADRNKTVMDVIGSLWTQGNLTMARNLTESMLKGYLPDRINYEIFMGDTPIYNSSPIANPGTKITASTAVSGYRIGVPTSGYLARAWVSKATGNETKIVEMSPMGSGCSDSQCGAGLGGNFSFIKSFELPQDARDFNGTLDLSIHEEGGSVYVWINGIEQNFTLEGSSAKKETKKKKTKYTTDPVYDSIEVSGFQPGNNTLKVLLTEPQNYHSHTHPGMLLKVRYLADKNIDYVTESENYRLANLTYVEGFPMVWGIFPFDIPAGSRINQVRIHVEGSDVNTYGDIHINNISVWSDTTPPLNPVVDLDVTDKVYQIPVRNATGETNTLAIYFDIKPAGDADESGATGIARILNTSYILLNYTVPNPMQKYGYFSFDKRVSFDRIENLTRIGRKDLNNGERPLYSAVIDPDGAYAYFGTGTSAGRVVKLDLSNFSRVGAITLAAGENNLTSAVMGPDGKVAYFGTKTSPGRVVRVNLTTFTRIGNLTLNNGEDNLISAVIDPNGQFAYFGTGTVPGIVVKVNLTNFTRVGAITLAAGENNLTSAVIDPDGEAAYFGTRTSPGIVVKVNLTNFTRVGAITLAAGENNLVSAVMEPYGGFAYFGTATSPGIVVKVNLASFSRVGNLTFAVGENALYSAVIDPNGQFAYFGTGTSPGRVTKVRLSDFARVANLTLNDEDDVLYSAVIGITGEYAYFGTHRSPAGRVVKVYLNPRGGARTMQVDWNVSETEIASAYLHVAQIAGWRVAAAAWHNPEATPGWNKVTERWEPLSMQIFKSPTGRNVPSSIYVRLDRLAKNTTNFVIANDFGGSADNYILPDSTVEYTVIAPGTVGYGNVFNTSSEATSDALLRLAALVAPYNLTYTAAVDSSNIAGISWLWSPTRLKVVVGA